MKKSFILLVLLLTNSFLGICQLTSRGLVAFYPFEGNAKTTQANYLNNGSVVRASLAMGRKGDTSSAYYFNNGPLTTESDKEYITIPVLTKCKGDSIHLLKGDFTIVFWIKSNETGRSMFAFSIDSNQVTNNLNIEFNSGGGAEVSWNSKSITGISGGLLNQYTDNSWHQVALRREADTIDLLIDATLTGTYIYNSTAPFCSDRDSIVLGFNNAVGPYDLLPQGWQGYIDDLYLYNRALGNTELVEPTPSAGLVAFLPFNGNANDESGNGNNGMIKGASLTKDRRGESNSAYHFDSTAYIKLAPLFLNQDTSLPANVFSGDFTIAFWERSSSNHRAYAFSIDPSCSINPAKNLNIEINDGGGYWAYWNSNGDYGVWGGYSGSYSNNKWHHIVLKRSVAPHKVEVFIDGLKVGEDTLHFRPMIGSDMEDIYLGWNKTSDSSNCWRGELDDLAIYSKLLSETEIQLMASDYLITDLPFNGSVLDKSIYKNPVSIACTSTDTTDKPSLTRDRFGNCDAAYHFNGNGYLQLNAFSKNPALATLNIFQKDFTISFWEKGDTSNHPMYALSIDQLANDKNLNLKFNEGTGYLAYWNSNGSTAISGDALNAYTDSLWHHILLERDLSQNQMRLYIDGDLKGTASCSSSTIGSDTTDIILGHNRSPEGILNHNYNDFGWRGDLDEVKIYNRLLSSAERQTILDHQEFNSLQIQYPKSTQHLAINSKHYITWTSNFDSKLFLEYSKDSVVWNTISDTVAAVTGGSRFNKYLWRIPDHTGFGYIRIYKTDKSCAISYAKFPIIPSQEDNYYKWDSITEAPFKGRDGAGALLYNNEMWLLGGWNPDDTVSFTNACSNEVWKSADEGTSWTKERTNSAVVYPEKNIWEQRHTAGYVVHNDAMWIIGGDAIQQHYQNDVWYSKNGRQWNRVEEEVPWKDRVLHHTLTYDNKIWVMGGQKLPEFLEDNAEKFYNDVWNSSDGKTWNKVTDSASWEPRGTICGNVVFNNKMWILGGGTYETPQQNYRTYYSDVWSSTDGVHWEEHVDFAPWPFRQYHNITVYDNKMWVLGGFIGPNTNRNDVWYSSDGINWYELPATPWMPRHAASVYANDKALWVVAGNNMVSDVWKLCRGGEDCEYHPVTENNSSDVFLYPNPTDGAVHIQLLSKAIQVWVKDVTGRTILHKHLTPTQKVELDISTFVPGIYFIEMTQINGPVVRKKVIKL